MFDIKLYIYVKSSSTSMQRRPSVKMWLIKFITIHGTLNSFTRAFIVELCYRHVHKLLLFM